MLQIVADTSNPCVLESSPPRRGRKRTITMTQKKLPKVEAISTTPGTKRKRGRPRKTVDNKDVPQNVKVPIVKNKTETLEESTRKVVTMMQEKVDVPFSEIKEELGDSRRAYDILNVLLSVPSACPIISQVKDSEKKVGKDFRFLDGYPLPGIGDVASLKARMKKERRCIERLIQSIAELGAEDGVEVEEGKDM
jgi:hypothetical protein